MPEDTSTVVAPAASVTATPTVSPTPAPGNPWYHGADAETVGHIQTKGWHTLTPDKAALAAVTAHREAERFIGVPANQLIRLPTDAADEAGWKTVYAKMGVPTDATGYKFDGLKFADGSDLTPAFADTMRNAAVKFHLTPDAATGLTAEVMKFIESTEASDASETAAKIAEQTAALKANWGPNYEANLFVARQAAQALGVNAELLNTLEGALGGDKVMEMFRSIGARIGEDRFVTGSNPAGSGGVMTKEQAVARKAELMKDAVWVKSYLSGDAQRGREMMALNTIIVGSG